MDGNGRWARERHLPVGAGHRAGARALKRVVRAAADAGIKDLTVFSFSTENWSRPDDEVGDLMGLFCELIDREVPELQRGARAASASSAALRRARRRAARADRRGRGDSRPATTRLRLFVAMNYGGRREIVDAARRFAAECGPEAGEAEFAQYLYAPDLRDPELVIRTSGEQRLSNFLLWQCAYAELHFSHAPVARLRARGPGARDRRVRGAATAGSAGGERLAGRLCEPAARRGPRHRPRDRGGGARRRRCSRSRWPLIAVLGLYELYSLTAAARPLRWAGYLGTLA